MSKFYTDYVANDALHRASSDALLSARDELEASLRDTNKAALFATLSEAGISQVIVSFDGYGDEGQIQNVEAKADDDLVDLPDARVCVRVAEWGQAEPVEQDLSLADLIEQLAYDYLGDTYAGWENGDGAFGTFVFDVAAGTITLDYDERYTATNNYTHEF